MGISVSGMQRPGILTFGEEVPALVLSQLGESGGAALVIDIETGRIVAASPEAARLLGLAPGEPRSLDAASPALVTLRAIARAEPRGDRSHVPSASLLFWTRDRVLRLPCRVRFEDGPPLLAIVHLLERTRDADETAAPLSDDAARLKEIARRIREGHGARGLPHGTQEPQDVQELGDGSQGAHLTTGGPGSTALPLKARLAHELRTPVSAIAAAAEIMKEQRLGPIGTARYLDYASDIHASAEHALSVIERMLADARVTTDGAGASTFSSAELSFAELDAGSVLTSTVSQIAPLAERAHIALALEIMPRLPRVVADATSLRQIVLNLLSNALKFTAPGGSVTVSAHCDLDGPLTITVSDSGQSLGPREDDAEIAVAQDSATGEGADPLSASNPGLGLGLPLVRALAAANGATLLIRSAPGRGTAAAIVFGRERVVPV